jgi:nickel/cobalt transporter (NiCoT) family protein
MSIWLIMIFPTLFAAGMSLIDTTDGVLMLGAYRWAFVEPARKLHYNLVITAVSVAVAALIGTVQALGLVGAQFGWRGGLWDMVGTFAENFNTIGFVIVGLFILAWVASLTMYRYGRRDWEAVAVPRANVSISQPTRATPQMSATALLK